MDLNLMVPNVPTSGGERLAEILLVEDNPADARLTLEALREGRVRSHLHHVSDGVEALAFLRGEAPHAGAPRPDLILLDLNMPRKGGREVLAALKENLELRDIPVVVLTSSTADRDVRDAYGLHANCYITKPVDLDRFLDIVCVVADFWLTVVTLPNGGDHALSKTALAA
jgi:CheY-like chemotaxis protein